MEEMRRSGEGEVLMSALYTGKAVTSTISMVSGELFAHFKEIFESLDRDGY